MLKTQQRVFLFLFFNKRFATRMSTNLWFKVTYIKVTYLFVGRHFVKRKKKTEESMKFF